MYIGNGNLTKVQFGTVNDGSLVFDDNESVTTVFTGEIQKCIIVIICIGMLHGKDSYIIHPSSNFSLKWSMVVKQFSFSSKTVMMLSKEPREIYCSTLFYYGSALRLQDTALHRRQISEAHASFPLCSLMKSLIYTHYTLYFYLKGLNLCNTHLPTQSYS